MYFSLSVVILKALQIVGCDHSNLSELFTLLALDLVVGVVVVVFGEIFTLASSCSLTLFFVLSEVFGVFQIFLEECIPWKRKKSEII